MSSFRLPPPARSFKGQSENLTNVDDLSIKDLLYSGVGKLLEVIDVIDDDRVKEYFELVDQLDLKLEDEAVETITQDSTNHYVSTVRDEVVAKERTRLQFSNRVMLVDESAASGFRSDSITPEERQLLESRLDAVLEVQVTVQNLSAIRSSNDVVNDTFSAALFEPITKTQTLLMDYVKRYSVDDPVSGKPSLVYYRSRAHPPELRSAIRSLGNINDLLRVYVDDPYEFLATYCICRDPNIKERTEKAIQEIIQEQYTECFDEILKERAAKRRAKSARIVLDAAMQSTNALDEPLGELDATDTTRAKLEREVGIDHKIEVVEIGTRMARSPLKDARPQEARVLKVSYMGRSVLIVYAYDHNLRSMTDRNREKYTKSNGKIHPYDSVLKFTAQQLLSGQSPEQLDSKTTMYVRLKPRSEAYQGITLAGKKVKTANDSKIYFTFAEASEVLVNSAHDTTQCIVVLAETDKSNQLAVLQRITGQDASDIRSRRAGIR